MEKHKFNENLNKIARKGLHNLILDKFGYSVAKFYFTDYRNEYFKNLPSSMANRIAMYEITENEFLKMFP